MSLKRYYISGLHPHIWEHPEGEMVYFEDYVALWADYARLKAEVERLQNNCDYLDRELDREIEKTAMLCGQVERLTDAITRGTAITPDAHPQP